MHGVWISPQHPHKHIPLIGSPKPRRRVVVTCKTELWLVVTTANDWSKWQHLPQEGSCLEERGKTAGNWVKNILYTAKNVAFPLPILVGWTDMECTANCSTQASLETRVLKVTIIGHCSHYTSQHSQSQTYFLISFPFHWLRKWGFIICLSPLLVVIQLRNMSVFIECGQNLSQWGKKAFLSSTEALLKRNSITVFKTG